jgi:hypothetical protein
MVPETVLRLVPYLGTFILASAGEEAQFCCPFHEKQGQKDQNYHFYVRIVDHKQGHTCKSCLGHWNCRSCGASGRALDTLYSRLGLVLESEAPAPEDVYEKVCAILNSKAIRAQVGKPKDIGLPDDYKTVTPGTLAWDYALSRGLTESDIRDYQLGYGLKELAWRLIIPNQSETGYDMWQARWYHPSEKTKIKYRTPTGALDSLVLFNRLRASKYRTVIICEGPISAIIAGPNAVASWGKHLSAAHVELLLKMKADEYWVAYDGDAVLSGLASASTIYARGRKVRFLRLPSKEDPASLGREGTLSIGANSPYFTEMTPALVLAGAA